MLNDLEQGFEEFRQELEAEPVEFQDEFEVDTNVSLERFPVSKPMHIVPGSATQYLTNSGEADLASLLFRAGSRIAEATYRQIADDFRHCVLERTASDDQVWVGLFAGHAEQTELLETPVEFRASGELTKVLVASQLQLRTSLGQSTKDVLVASSTTEFVREFSEAILQQFTQFAQELRYSQSGRVLISTGKSFDAHVQMRLCDTFFIVPDKSTQFLSLLHRDLMQFLKAGGGVSGRWGTYDVGADDNLFVDLAPRKDSDEESWVGAKRLE